jgi:hypothetical protein
VNGGPELAFEFTGGPWSGRALRKDFESLAWYHGCHVDVRTSSGWFLRTYFFRVTGPDEGLRAFAAKAEEVQRRIQELNR